MPRKDFVIPDENGNILCTLRCNFESEAYEKLLDSKKIQIELGTDTKDMIVVNEKLKKKGFLQKLRKR